MNNVKVSIIIPVYNGANYLSEAIESAINQTYSNIEVIVVNDGSDDDGLTEKICLSYGDKIKYIKKENGGVSSALNIGINNMTGDYFSWLSHDDIYLNNRIEIMVNELANVSKDVILYSNYAYINEVGKELFTTHFNTIKELDQKWEYSLYRSLLCGLTLLIPKDAFKLCGCFDEKLSCVQDYMFFYKLMKHYRFKLVNAVTAFSRVHSKQVTLTSSKMQRENDFFWKYLIDNTSEDIMIKLDGSKYGFYSNLEKFLKYNNISDDAVKYCESLKKSCEFVFIKREKVISTFTHYEKLIFILKNQGIIVLIKKIFRRFINVVK